MTDFTKKGTKLPVIPVGTNFRWLKDGIFKEPLRGNQMVLYVTYDDFISLGKFKHKKQTYVICDTKNAILTNFRYLIKLSTIERLAKEQGMCDDETMKIGFVTNWASKSFYNSINLECAMNKITIESKDKIRISHNPIKSNWIFEEFRTYKSQQMNPTIKLQENGTVTVTDTETTTTLSKVTVDEICRLVNEQPNPTIELNKWNYWDCKEDDVKMLLFVTGVDYENHKVKGYGFRNDEWVDECNCYCNIKNFNDAIYNYQPATPKTVEQFLKAEAVKRGYEKCTKYKHIKFDTVEVLKQPENLKLNIEYNNLTDGCGGSIFDEGVWATILKPETITKAEAEKELGKVIMD